MATPLVSVATATHDRGDRLFALLAALRAQTLPSADFEVVIVDDASSDGTPAILDRELQLGELRLRAVRNDKSRGPATARNRGWRLADAPLIAFTDDDCVPTEGWLESLVAAARAHGDTIVRGRTLPNPSESHALGPFAKTVRIEGPSPHYETCNVAYPRALLERSAASTRPTRARLERTPTWVRALSRPAVFRASRPTRWCITRCSPVGHWPLCVMRSWRPKASRRTSAIPSCEPTSHSASSMTVRTRCWAQAVVGALLARRNPHAAVLAVPYLRNVRNRTLASGGRSAQAAFFPLFDVVQIASTVRGAVRNRTFIL